eukprot:365989-Chlamydomonas_euryale.AAC.9
MPAGACRKRQTTTAPRRSRLRRHRRRAKSWLMPQRRPRVSASAGGWVSRGVGEGGRNSGGRPWRYRCSRCAQQRGTTADCR